MALVENSVARLLREEAELLTLKVGEQTLAQHLAAYIRAGVPKELAVDVEYNRHGHGKKELLITPNGGSESVPTVVRPDIVVHSRGNDHSNILAIEVKKPGTDLSHDRRKLEALKQQYGYKLAAHVVVGSQGENLVGAVEWVNG